MSTLEIFFLNVISAAIPSLLLANLLVIAILAMCNIKKDWSLLPKIQPRLLKAGGICFCILFVFLTATGSPNQESPLLQLLAGAIPAVLCIIASIPGLWGCLFLTNKQTESDELIRDLKQDRSRCNERITSLERALDHRRNVLNDIKDLLATDKRLPKVVRDELLNRISDIEQAERSKPKKKHHARQ